MERRSPRVPGLSARLLGGLVAACALWAPAPRAADGPPERAPSVAVADTVDWPLSLVGARAGPVRWAAAVARAADSTDGTAARPDLPLRVDAVGARRVDAAPGEVLTAVFRVTNPGPEPRLADGALDLPPGWTSLLPARPLTVGGGASDLQIVSVQVPADAPPGRYAVRYVVDGETAALAVEVAAVYGLALEAEAAPRVAAAGAPYQVQMLLVNTGNTPVTAALRATSNAGLPLRLDSARVRLRPGELRRVTVTAEPPATARRLRHVVRVDAEVEAPAGAATAGRAAVTDVVPPAGQVARGDALDAEVAVRGVHSRGALGGQVDLAGTVPALGGTVEALVTVADRERPSVYRGRSRYSLRYRADGLTVSAGDHVFGLSPLTETARYGFGVGAEHDAGRLAVGGFVHRQRYAVDGDAFAGAFAGVRVRDGAEVRANVLHRSGARGGDAATVRALIGQLGATSLDAECGLGTGATSGGGPTRACSARVRLDRPWLSTTASVVGADPGFPGRYRDVRAASASGVLRPLPGVRVEGAWHDRQHGETLGASASRHYRAGASLAGRAVGRRGQVAVYRTGYRLADAPGEPGREERSTQVVAAVDVGGIGLRASAEAGTVDAPPSGAGGAFHHVRARVRASPWGQSVHLGIERRRGPSLYAPGAASSWRADLGAAFALARRTRLSLTASASTDEPDAGAAVPRRTHALVQGRFEHALPSGHRVEVEGRHLALGGPLGSRVDEVRVSYVVPLRVPVGLRGDVVTGRVFDAETGAGLAGVAVTLGTDLALTDADGVFYLPRPAGTASLDIDRVTAGIDRVPMIALPLEVSPDEPAGPIEIPMVRGARLTGQFGVSAPSPPALGNAPAPGSVERAVLEMTGPGGRLRAVSDRQGRFAFEGVPPGDWTLRVLHAELPAHHAVERESYAVTLGPGEQGRLEIGVAPRQRRIRLLESGTVLSEAPPASGPSVKSP
ncbi:hypothetical protein [Rubrivirga sp.]|uniref:hypothetical protein n=1 Tax=Rubrivirga sp. TaxID=1885344 RepID=UPI003B51DE06